MEKSYGTPKIFVGANEGQINIASGNSSITSVSNSSSSTTRVQVHHTGHMVTPDKLKRRISLLEKRLACDDISPEDRYDLEKWLDETKEEYYACQQ